MCPDRELLSAWVDGEVPSPWKETLERHLAACGDCSAAAARMKALSAALSSESGSLDAAAALAKARVLDRLFESRPYRAPRAWARKFVLPVPVAAAALVGFVAMGFALAQSGARNAELRLAVQRASEAPSVAASGLGMESIIEYLAKQDAGVNITITLPTGSAMEAPGEPFMIREADFQPGGGK